MIIQQNISAFLAFALSLWFIFFIISQNLIRKILASLTRRASLTSLACCFFSNMQPSFISHQAMLLSYTLSRLYWIVLFFTQILPDVFPLLVYNPKQVSPSGLQLKASFPSNLKPNSTSYHFSSIFFNKKKLYPLCTFSPSLQPQVCFPSNLELSSTRYYFCSVIYSNIYYFIGKNLASYGQIGRAHV